ncbi:unnamed protein product [Rotaria sp. Silwood2]|nr:unnamed protein product [Rotaria sp. Silwood2]CAF3126079.1 unnamed protein product [Rotaria sp. Silwood2]CAF3976742.1 unnamed protein product [Rotaria sp. Silwood2]CAF4608956.1 unnamed protein product [Rotaria sp. Silwood2]
MPLVSIETSGTSSLKTMNTIRSTSSAFSLIHSGTSEANIELNHTSDLILQISGTSDVQLKGQVEGNARITVTGVGKLAALDCPMGRVDINVAGAGSAYINSKQGVYASASGASTIYYEGTLKSGKTTGASSIKSYFSNGNDDENENWLDLWSRSTKVVTGSWILLIFLGVIGYFICY